MILRSVPEKVIVSHDPVNKVHHLDLELRIPLDFSEIEKGYKRKTTYPFTSPKILINRGNSFPPDALYSTVTDLARLRG